MEKYFREFDDYVKNFDMSDSNIISKYNHSYRVMKLQDKYSKIIGFDTYNTELAKLIGLLHDIGRFKQYKEYSTFSDTKSVDHADLGSKILFEDGLINKFWTIKADYEIIDFAIKNHSKFKISEIDDKSLMDHAKLIRDTDKLDILYLMGKLGEYKKYNDSKLSPKIIETIYEHNLINKKDVNHSNDAKAIYFSFAFDINNIEILEELRSNLISFYEITNHDKIFDEVYNEVNKYIDERTGKNVRKKIQSLRS